MIKYNNPVLNKYEVRTLPVPRMFETMEKFLSWVKPLITEEEYVEAKKEVDQFLNSNLSSILQNRLINKSIGKDENWMSEWWMDYTYLASRGPVTPECNAPISMLFPTLNNVAALEKVGIVMYAVAVFYNKFKNEGVPDFVVRDKRYSLDQLHGLLAAMRHPQVHMDVYEINEDQSEHIAFAFRNRIYEIQVIRDNNPVSYNEIVSTLKKIVNQDQEPKVPNVNYVSISTNRDHAAITLERILEDEKNSEAYEKIKHSIIFASYDEYEPQNMTDELDNIVYNKEFVNRWHGKSVNFSFDGAGNIGFVVDHTYIDGGTEMFFTESLNQIIGKMELDIQDIELTNDIKEIEFTFSDDIAHELTKYKRDYDAYMNNVSYEKVIFEGLTRELLKECGVVSGDSFIHLVYQMAQKKTFGKYFNTYIAVDNRTFFKGRTECVRPVSMQSVTFIEEFMKQEKSHEELLKLMRASMDEQYKRLKDCQNGLGVNRHLFGLQMAAIELDLVNEIPLFRTQAWKVIANNRLSTSSVVAPNVKICYFQPVEADGFGIYYVVHKESFMVISSFKKDEALRKTFISNVHESLQELLQFVKKNVEVIHHV
ncbi:choline/carnitine O-acyltransferase [Bacillus massiliigorillae]|uniref:choline/carnitine O-acyltransferase n=1 Tax=Bacillus massiliigorillae TaxID=1243664 RepID=UPI00039B7EBF|nr:choline/carnitine O-acyltransferase [Bacillus massiliigorillae]